MATNAFSPLLFLWEQRTLFIGSLEDPLDISTGASTLLLGLDKPIRFMTSEMQAPLECHSLLMPAGTSVIIDTQGSMIANCTLDPLGEDLHALEKFMQLKVGKVSYHLENEQMHISKFKQVFSAPLDAHGVLRSLIQFLDIKTAFQGTAPHHEIDPRIRQIILIIQKTINENISLSDLAKRANLSPSRLTQLFKKQTGLPLRRYRLWYRLYMTALKTGQGRSLTEAAFEAGFTDSPHFNHTFRSMLGMTPSCIFSQAQQLQIILPSSTQTRSASVSQYEILANKKAAV